MKDRLEELCGLQRSLSSDLPPENEGTASDEEHASASSDTCLLQNFFCQIGEIALKIRDLKQRVAEVKIKQDTILSDPWPERQAKDELNDITAVINEKTTNIRNSFKSIEREIKQDIEKETKWKQELKQEQVELGLTVTRNLDGDSVELRIKKSHFAKVFEEFSHVMSEYNEIQNEYSEKWKIRMARQFEIIGKTVSDKKLNEMLSNRRFSVFTQEISITEKQESKQSLRDLETTHKEIIQLEKCIQDLHELFVEMAFIIKSQGALVDNIEHNVQNAMEYVSNAKSHLGSALISRDEYRKKKILLTICCLLLVGSLVSALVLTLIRAGR